MILKNGRRPDVVVDERGQFGAAKRVARAVTREFSGAVVGTVSGLARNGEALVDLPDGFRRTRARSCIRLASTDVGREAVLLFEGGDHTRPIIVGLVQGPEKDASARTDIVSSAAATYEVEVDDRKVELVARETITLRCGEASITLNQDGKIVIRGKHVVSHAAGVNRIRGGSVQLN
jgi:hypothetical protein